MKTTTTIKISVVIFAVVFLTGCATLPYVYRTGVEGYRSPEGVAAKAAITTVAQPLVGEPWSTILGSIAGILLGGAAVHKRRKYLDTPTK